MFSGISMVRLLPLGPERGREGAREAVEGPETQGEPRSSIEWDFDSVESTPGGGSIPGRFLNDEGTEVAGPDEDSTKALGVH
jgi:hypothetical protein